jgi:hypothetical protein
LALLANERKKPHDPAWRPTYSRLPGPPKDSSSYSRNYSRRRIEPHRLFDRLTAAWGKSDMLHRADWIAAIVLLGFLTLACEACQRGPTWANAIAAMVLLALLFVGSAGLQKGLPPPTV